MSNLTFGQFLRKVRQSKNITGRSLAEHLKMSPPYISEVERGGRPPLYYDKLVEIKNFLNLDKGETETLMNLAGRGRNEIAPDLVKYIVEHPEVNNFIRLARDEMWTSTDWLELLKQLKNDQIHSSFD